MNKKRLVWLASGLALAALLAAVFLHLNPVTKQSSQPPWQQQRSGNGRFTNLTEEEMQRMFEERMQAAVAACRDKAEGTACTMQGPRGEATGTCRAQDGKLMCIGMVRGNNDDFRPGEWVGG